jgi:hypothetical protein
MNWQDLGGALVKAGAPIIGRALGGPLGGMIGDAVGGVLADALGVAPNPDAVDSAIKTAPAGELSAKLSAAEAEAQAKWPALAEIAKADAEAQAGALAETHETMRIEAASGDIVQRWWRPIYAFELTLECTICWALAMWDLAFGAGKIAAWAVNASGLLSVYWGARFGVLGVYVNGRSREKEAALTGQSAPTAIDTLVKAATRKLRR